MNSFRGKKRKEYVIRMTDDVSKLIATNYHISFKQAKHDFTKSQVFNYLAFANEDFVEEGPLDFYDLYVNLKKTGGMVSSTDLYLEKHPELYSILQKPQQVYYLFFIGPGLVNKSWTLIIKISMQ